MKKETGKIIIECYDKYGHKVIDYNDETCYTLALARAVDWENKNEGNTSVISRIMYNTVCNNDKWSYTNGHKRVKG